MDNYLLIVSGAFEILQTNAGFDTVQSIIKEVKKLDHYTDTMITQALKAFNYNAEILAIKMEYDL